jgi:hypothetical protein
MKLHSSDINDASFSTIPARSGSILVANIGLENLVLHRRVEI